MKKAFAVFGALVVALIAFLWLHESLFYTIPLDGFVYPGDEIKSNLINGGDQAEDFNAVTVSDGDDVYVARQSYFVESGTSRSGLTLSLPLISKDGKQILILSQGEAITSNYERLETFRGAVITNNQMYDIANGEQVDREKYILIKADTDIYVNATKIKVHPSNRSTEIPSSSLVFFERNAIRYYDLDLKDAKYQYHEITGIDLSDEIEVLEEKMTYREFLRRLGIWRPESIREQPEVAQEPVDEEEEIEEETTTVIEQQVVPRKKKRVTSDEEYEVDDSAFVYNDKLEVRASFIDAKIYSATFDIYVHDPKNEIVRYPTIEIYKGSSLYSRRTVYATSQQEVTMLAPDTNYHYEIYYIYRNEDGRQIRSVLSEGDFSTNPLDAGRTVNFAYDSIIPSTNNVTLVNFALDNERDDEILKGLQKIVISTSDGQEIKLDTNIVADLRQGEKRTYATPNILSSNTLYHFTIKAFDVNGDELPSTNSEFDFKTAKAVPTATLKLLDYNLTWFSAQVRINNPDNVELKNLKYEVLDRGRIIRESVLDPSFNIEESDLNEGTTYDLAIFADYDLGDGNGIQEKIELTRMSFTLTSISSLGNLNLLLETPTITKDSASFDTSISKRETNAQLIDLLDSLTINLFDSNDNLIETRDIDTDTINALKNSGIVPLSYKNIPTNTTYYISATANIKQGNQLYAVSVQLNRENRYSFKTLKEPAVVEMINKLATPSMIDYNIKIEDIDEAILSGRVIMEVRSQYNKLIGIEYLGTNVDNARFRYTKLDINTTYKITFIAEKYNEGHLDQTQRSNYHIADFTMFTDENGIVGDIQLNSVLSQRDKNEDGSEKSPNYYDISNNQRWKSSNGNSTVTDRKYDLGDNATIISAKNGRRTYSYYLPELYGQRITVSFKAKYQTAGSSDQPFYVGNGDGDIRNCRIDNISGKQLNADNYQFYSCTFDLTTNYIGFNIYEVANSNILSEISIKDLQIEPGNSATDYKPFPQKVDNDGDKLFLADLAVSLSDPKFDIDDDTYYIKLYRFSELVNGGEYQLDRESAVTTSNDIFDVKHNSDYVARLVIKHDGIEYEISSVSFTTEQEIRSVHNLDEFTKMHPTGKYTIANDIDFRSVTGTLFGSFEGIIDFQGHKMIMDVDGAPNQLFSSFYGTLRNVDIHTYLNNTGRRYYFGFTEYNWGTIENIMLTIEDAKDVPNWEFVPLVRYNYGIIDKFIVNLKHDIYGVRQFSTLVYYNYNIIRNGYLYSSNGASIKGQYNEWVNANPKGIGAIACYGTGSAKFENVYSLINVHMENGDPYPAANLIGRVENGATMKNMYSNAYAGANRTTSRDINWIPNSSYNSANFNIEDLYYVSNIEFADNGSARIPTTILKDANFQDIVLNDTYGAFDVESRTHYGYYPVLDLPDSMPAQDYIEITGPDDTVSVDVTSVLEVVHNEKTDSSPANDIVTLKVYNPYHYKVTALNITNLGSTTDNTNKIEIVSQLDYGSNSDLKFKIEKPKYYYSSYYLSSITTVTSFGASSTRNYGAKERNLEIELFKDIANFSDWNSVFNNSKSGNRENYRLTEDIDFDGQVLNNFIVKNFYGVIEGGEHTIKNINANGTAMFNGFYGTLRNLYVDNYVKTGNPATYGGLIDTANSGSLIDNVHLSNIRTVGHTYIGGLVGLANSATIRNSSITGFSLENVGVTYVETIVGGLIGGIQSSSTIQNCFAKDIDIDSRQSPNIYSVGGLIGKINGAGSVENVYATGTIQTKTPTNGGIIGWASNYGVLRNAYSNVDIFSSSNVDIGGIIGEVSLPSRFSTSNTLSAGMIYSSLTGGTVKRILGGDIIILQPNFAWHDQHINGVVTEDTSGETLLSTADLNQQTTYQNIIRLGDYFSYDELGDGSLPRLYNLERSAILTGEKQQKNYLKEYDFEVQPIVINTTPDGSINYIQLSIYHPSDVAEITSIDIDDVLIRSTRRTELIDSSGKPYTNFEITGGKAQYFYDSYRLSKIHYHLSDSDTDQVFVDDTKINMQFYHDIRTVSDWEKINKTGFENYRLMNDLDVSTLSEEYRNGQGIFINRLEGMQDNIDADGKVIPKTISGLNINSSGNNISFIHSVNSSLKNIAFENATITANGSGEKVGIVLFEYGEIDNLAFRNVTISATNYNYVGMVSENFSFDTKNIKISNSNISGKEHVGGYSGRMKWYGVANVQVTDSTITGTGNYVGGFVGEQRTASKLVQFNISAENILVKGVNYVGGIYGRGTGREVTIKNSHCTKNASGGCASQDKGVFGHQYVGGISGVATSEQGTLSNNYAENISVVGTSNDIGGVIGQAGHTVTNSYAKNSDVSGVSYVGGVIGDVVWRGSPYWYIQNSYAEDVTVTGTGDYIGGISGQALVQKSRTTRVKVTGRDYVGGLLGQSGSTDTSYVQSGTINGRHYVGGAIARNQWNSYGWTISRITVDNGTTVKATGTGAGGILGWADGNGNTTIERCVSGAASVTANTVAGGLVGGADNNEFQKITGQNNAISNYKIRYYHHNIIAVGEVSAATVASGFIGRVYLPANDVAGSSKTNYDGLQASRFYNNIIATNVKSTSTNPGFIFGEVVRASIDDKTTPDSYIKVGTSTRATNFKIYTNAKMTVGSTTATANNYTASALPRDAVTFVSLNELKTNSTYTSIGINSGFNFSELTNNKYPYLTDHAKILVPLPAALTMGMMSSPRSLGLRSTTISSELPDYIVYPSDVNTINVEFNNIDNTSTFSLNGETYPVSQRVFSFSYDFNTPIEFSLTNGINTKTATYDPDSLRGHLANVDNYYYILKDGAIITNHEGYNIPAINLYKDKILTSDHKIIDLSNDGLEATETEFENLASLETPVPLYKFKNIDLSVDTYAKFSIVNHDTIVEQQLLYKGAQTEIVSPSLKNIKWQEIMDSYNNDDYLTILGEDGIIYDLKTKLKYPESFVNSEIKEISNNVQSDESIFMVLYEDGRVVVFDYHNGAVIYRLQADTIVTPLEYILNQTSGKDEGLYDSDQLEDNLSKTEQLVSEIKGGSAVSNKTEISSTGNYVTSYNPVSETYDIYDLNTLTTDPLGVSSISNKIQKDNTLNLRFGKYLSSDPGLPAPIVITYVAIGTLIVISITVLGKIIRKNTEKTIPFM